MTITPKTKLRITIIASVVGLLYAYSNMQVVCPYCHNSDGNVKGACVLRQRTGACPEDYYDQHHNKTHCPWCGARGRMSRIDAWLD